MTKVFLWVVACLLLVGVNAFAGDGDLIVNGKLGVGVGTTSPRETVEVDNNDGTAYLPTQSVNGWLTDNKAGVLLYNPSSSIGAYTGLTIAVGGSGSFTGYIGGVYQGSFSPNSAMVFSTRDSSSNTIERMRISSSGNVGIGTATPASKLDIVGNGGDATFPSSMRITESLATHTRGILQIKSTNWGADHIQLLGRALSDSASGIYFASNDGSTNFWDITGYNDGFGIERYGSGYAIFIASSKNVGIGTTNPSYTLHVVGTSYTTNGQWAGSDIRWKKNITPLDNSLDQVMKLQGVSYDWRTEEFKEKNFEEGRQIGFIAQEVEKVIPEMVKTDSEGYKSVSYEKITAVLVEAMKEQQRQIEELKSELKRIKAKN